MIKLTVLSGPDAGQEFTFAGVAVVIGKSHTCEVILHDGYVGRRHCCISQHGDRFFLEDLQSRNGTFLNDREHRISTPQPLEEVSQLFIGSTCIRVEVSAEDEAKTLLNQPAERETQRQQSSSAPPPRPETVEAHPPERLTAVRQPEAPIVITVVDGPDRGMVYSPPQDVFTIGRSDACDITLHDVRISRTHASIKREGGRYRLYDENTTNGTFLRAPDTRVFHADLADNDVIYLGQTQLRVELRASASTSPAPSDGDATRISGMLQGKDFTFTFALPARGARHIQQTQIEENVFGEADLTEIGTVPPPYLLASRTEEPQGLRLVLRVIEGLDTGTVYSPPPDTKEFTVGRGQNADFCLQERGASRLHFSIKIGEVKVELIDQGSLNGTFVNNSAERVTRITLKNRDEIRIYNTRLKVELSLPDEPTAPAPLPTTPSAQQGETSTPQPQAATSPDLQTGQSLDAPPQVEKVESRSTTFKKRLAEIEKQKGVNLRPFTMPGILQWATLLLLLIGLASSYGFFLLGRPASFSGGDLIDGHIKKVQNDCAQCHPPWGVQSINVTCVASGCHADVLTKGKEHVHFDRRQPPVRDDCVSCHTEHRGRNFDITGTKERGVEFDLTGNKTGAKTFCWKCHTDGQQTRRFQLRPLATYYSAVVLVAEASPSASGQSANPMQAQVPATEQPRLSWLRRVGAQESGLKYGHTIHDRQVFEKDGKRLDCTVCHAQAKESVGQQSASAVEGGVAFPTHAQCIDCHAEAENRDPQMAKNHPSEKCLLCHTKQDGGITRVRRHINYVNFSHESHTKAYLACERCHAVVLGETEYRPVLRSESAYPVPMNACYGCHEKSKDRFPRATVACLDCHGSHHNYAPPSPTVSSWLTQLSLSNVLLALFALVAGMTLYSYADARMTRRWWEEEEVAEEEEESQASAPVAAPAAGEGDVLPFPIVDASTCISCGKCYDSCPTNVLASEPETHKSIVVHPEVCKSLEGCRICQDGCPTGAIRVTAGPPVRNVERAQIDEHNESNITGLFLVGEVIGAAQIKKAVNQGDQVIRYIADRKPRLADAPYDVIIVGAGPAGLGAALEAKRKKLRYLLLERATVASTIRDYPRDKAVLGEPVLVPQYGLLPMPNTAQKEELIVAWEKIIRESGLQIHEREEVINIKKTHGLFSVTTSQRTYEGAYVVIAIGTRGNPRKIGAPGEELPKVAYNLIDAAEFAGKKILIVGGGDSAVEAAVALAKQKGTSVSISYRRGEFSRIKPKNADALAEQEEAGRVTIFFHSTVAAIHDTTVTLKVGEESQELANDMVFALIGADPPNDWLKKLGIEIVAVQEIVGEQW